MWPSPAGPDSGPYAIAVVDDDNLASIRAWLKQNPAQAQGVKLNDLFMAMVAGAVGGFLQATVEIALDRPDLAVPFRDYLREIVGSRE